ncbi:hypothetical protein D3C74_88560 [compost metagenome]
MRFDPTIFDNLKVALENELYDLDNLDGTIRITGRKDLLEMSVMSRRCAIQFELAEASGVTAELQLDTGLMDLAAEVLELEGHVPGCQVLLAFAMKAGAEDELRAQCEHARQVLTDDWSAEADLAQRIAYSYGASSPVYSHTAELRFRRRIDEEQMEDLTELVKHAVASLRKLSRLD